MAEPSPPGDDDLKQVIALTGVDEASAKKVLEESGGDMTMTINRLLDLEVDVSALNLYKKSSHLCFRTKALLRLRWLRLLKNQPRLQQPRL